jgi:hypothetical protein
MKDNCEICQGRKGGVRGNENKVQGLVVCDYCHADIRADRLSAEEHLYWELHREGFSPWVA